MRFTYPFQKIVDLKLNEKKLAESVLSQAVGVLASKEQQLSSVQAEKLRVQEQLAVGAGTVSVSELTMKQQYVNFLEERIRTTQTEVRSAEHQVETRRVELSEKTIDQKVWMKARERAFLSHQHEVGKRTQNELDDIVSARWQRV